MSTDDFGGVAGYETLSTRARGAPLTQVLKYVLRTYFKRGRQERLSWQWAICRSPLRRNPRRNRHWQCKIRL